MVIIAWQWGFCPKKWYVTNGLLVVEMLEDRAPADKQLPATQGVRSWACATAPSPIVGVAFPQKRCSTYAICTAA
jgi:hypothetical protein